jgi:hypothetical protein
MADPTAAHFYSVCISEVRPISWISHEDIASAEVSFEVFRSSVARASGVYYRDYFVGRTEDALRVALAIRSVIWRSSNSIRQPLHSSNWAKAWHTTLLSGASTGIRVPRSRIVSEIETSASGVIKALGGVPAYAIDAEDIGRLLGVGPIHLQERIRGREVRAHVVGSRVFGHLIETSALDYRCGGYEKIANTQLTAEEERLLHRMAWQEGLLFAGIDFFRTDQGPVALEVNPMPGYHTYEVGGGGSPRISQALYALLSAE